MKMTIKLDDDTAAAVRRLCQQSGSRSKEIIHRALREGLKQLMSKPKPVAPFRTATASAGRCRIGDLVGTSEALAIAEGDDHK